jgi:DamX protein
MGNPDDPDSRLPIANSADEPPEFARLLTDDEGDGAAPAVMRDIEKSLVERIADVDDERRRTSTQVRKALSAHRDEVEQRLRTYRGLLMASLAGLALVAAGLLWLALAWSGERAQLGQQLAEIQQRLQTPAETVVVDPAPQQADDSRLAELQQRTQAMTSEIQALERAQASSEQRLQQQLETLADRLDAQPVQAATPPRDEQQAQALAALEQRVEAVSSELRSMITARLPNPHQAGPGQVVPDQVGPDQASPERAALDQLNQKQLNPDQPSSDQASDAGERAAVQTTLAESRIALQLIGYHSRDDVQQFIATHRLPRTVYLRRESYRGRPWYALIYGLYNTAEAASAARSRLPDDLAQLDIWLRELPPGTTLERIVAPAAD